MRLNFDRIRGQELAKFIFHDAITSEKIAPTYLFFGPRGVGKATFALEVAKILNCQNKTLKPCMECTSCIEIEKLSFPDLWVVLPDKVSRDKPGRWSRIRPQNYTPTLKTSIDQIRELEKEVSRPPVFGDYRVVIVLNAENLTIEAQNASLKLLEEHPEHTVFILVSDNTTQILTTITSRSRSIRFRLLTLNEFLKLTYPIEEKITLNLLYRLSQGSPGLTFRFIESNIISIRDELLEQWTEFGIKGLLESTVLTATEESDSTLILWILLSIFHDILLLRFGLRDLVANFDKIQILERFSKVLTFQNIEVFFTTVKEVEIGIKRNQNIRALFTMLIGTLFEPSYLDTFMG